MKHTWISCLDLNIILKLIHFVCANIPKSLYKKMNYKTWFKAFWTKDSSWQDVSGEGHLLQSLDYLCLIFQDLHSRKEWIPVTLTSMHTPCHTSQHVICLLKKEKASEMAQRVKAIATKPNDLRDQHSNRENWVSQVVL